jgi:hypothetical protein
MRSLPFTDIQCGPYCEEHAKILAGLPNATWPCRNKWVAAGRSSKWYVGRVVKTETNPINQLVSFNHGGKGWYDAFRTTVIEHDAPYILSGPYEWEFIQRIEAQDPRLPSPRPMRIIKPQKKAAPAIGQRVIGTARRFRAWWTGIIDTVRPEVGIVVISFDNGKRLGSLVPEFRYRPISAEFSGKVGPYTEREAEDVWQKHGLKIKDRKSPVT